MKKAGLASSAWTDLPDRAVTVVIPLGSIEQHGPHLPLDTDGRIAGEAARRAVEHVSEEGEDAVLAPTVPYGASGEHEGFPGTISIGSDALERQLVEIGRSACRWASRVVFVNGHGGNGGALLAAVDLLRYEGRDVAWYPCAFPNADGHAGATETAVLLAFSPGEVRMDAAVPGNTQPIGALMTRLRSEGVRAVSENGVLGDPTRADAADGGVQLDGLVGRLSAALRRWRVLDDGRLG
ncbi:MAG: mycofactocin biosynthesis peptidyl-dipeptidase MftE [Gordonia sp. (in: high G+C Gram-positive bacteria)]